MRSPRSRERGQMLVLFALSLTVLLGATGLVVDIGGSWGQERSQQKVADTAAMAGATAETNGATKAQIIAANPKMNPNVLIPGKKIFIPDAAAK